MAKKKVSEEVTVGGSGNISSIFSVIKKIDDEVEIIADSAHSNI